MFPEWTWIVGLWIGLCVGSFLNVVVYRLPRGLSVWNPVYSFCPNCRNRLTIPDLVPVFSWLALRGRCRHCRVPISPRYMAVEAVTGILWAGVWWQTLSGPHTLGEPLRAVVLSLFVSALVAAIFTDLAHYIIPDQINAFMLALGLAANVVLAAQGRPEAWIGPLPSSVVGALTGIGVLWGIAFLGRVLFRKDAMGHGDIKMARGIGAVLLPAMALAGFGIAVVLGAVLGIVTLLLRRRPSGAEGPEEGEEEGPEEPESLRSLLWCGLGYVLCVDVLGLFVPKIYEFWFGENPYSVEELEDDPRVELTMIPFGPYLAAGAIVAGLFEGAIREGVSAYLGSFQGGP